jgi:hypothetical protein
MEMASENVVDMLLAGREDMNWFNSHAAELKNTYGEKFVAFKDQRIIESDSDMNRLMEKLKRKNIDTSKVIVEFVTKVKKIL